MCGTQVSPCISLKIGFPHGILVGSILTILYLVFAFWVVSRAPLLGADALAALLGSAVVGPAGSILYARARRVSKIPSSYLIGSMLPSFVSGALLIFVLYIVLASAG